MALTCLAEREQRLTDDLICHGLARVSWPGRFQVLQVSGVDVVIDGAHNPAGIHTFCQTYGEVFGQRQRVFLFSVLADKDYTHMKNIMQNACIIFHKRVYYQSEINYVIVKYY